MKTPPVIRILSCMLGLFALGASGAYAQSEIDPDHFDSPNTEPFPQRKPYAESKVAETRFEGRFALPYSVLCSGNRLAPGKYTISLRSDGKAAQAILNGKGQNVGIVGVVHRQAYKRGNNALVVENQGKTRTLSVIEVTELDFIFDASEQIGSSPKNRTRRFERLPLTLLAPKRRRGAAE
ncbi:MAG TPA: hypothetical protein VIX91_13225 [Candidatus Acidoferrum sp.]